MPNCGEVTSKKDKWNRQRFEEMKETEIEKL